MTAGYENKKIDEGYDYVIGCDEVGRGSLAGPVVAAAVLLDLRLRIKDLSGVRDSKLLTADQREGLDPVIKQHAIAWGVGLVENLSLIHISEPTRQAEISY